MLRRAIPLAIALALTAAACGDDDGASGAAATATAEASDATSPATSQEISDEASSSSMPIAAGFPVTIEHKYGETTIESEPRRVISVGFTDQDWLLAVGIEPVAVREWYGEQPYATWPWAQDELGDAQPEVLPAAELNFEQIAALDPDLIVGITSGMTDVEYETLSQIAPTVAQPGEYIDYGVPWNVTTELIGRATGRTTEAAEVVEHVQGLFADARAAHPEFEGATAAVAYYYEGMPGAYASQDSRARLMSDLGFVTPPEFDELAGDAFFFSVSAEEIGKLDTDVIIWLVGDDLELPTIAGIPTRPSLEAYAEGREIVTDALLGGAFSFGSPLSIEYLLEHLVPELALAVDGDPSTVVPSVERLLADAADDTSGDTSGDTGGDTLADTEDDSSGSGLDAEQQAAADAWATVFDSTIGFDAKSGLLEDADALRATVESYATAGEAMGGISLVPTAVVVDGAAATITYDVMFGDTAAYSDLTGTIDKVGDTWVVPRSEFCSFMASARNACPA
jgi:iron complex transport system substrate-binding protein